MASIFQKAAWTIASAGILFISSCGTDTPTPNVDYDQEKVTNVRVTYNLLDNNGQPSGSVVQVNIDENGTANPETVQLEIGKKYKTEISFFNQSELLNNEIAGEATQHKVFLLTSQDGIINYEYNDMDPNGNGIGLNGTTTVMQAGTISLNLVLRHGLNKNNASAQGYNNTNYLQAGGVDDANVLFNIQAQ